MSRTLCLALTVLLARAATAHAQRAPTMATLDRGDGVSKVGLQVGLTVLESPPYDAALRLEPYAQLFLPGGLGFYGALPLSGSFGGGDNIQPLPRNAAALGNLDLGLLDVIAASPHVSFILRGGLALPTAARSSDGIATSTCAIAPRLTDRALTIPDAWYLRLAVSSLIRSRNLFFRADLGIDRGLGDDDDDVLRVNLGLGIDLDPLAFSLELATVGYPVREGDPFSSGLALTTDFAGELLQPFISIGTPLYGQLDAQVALFFAGGLQGAL